MNESEQVINILPITRKKKTQIEWQCGLLCKGNEMSIMNRFKEFLMSISNCSTVRNVPKLIKSIGVCTVKQSNKLGHSQACYIDHKLCKCKFLAFSVTALPYSEKYTKAHISFKALLRKTFETMMKMKP